MAIDLNKYYLGKLCKNNHDYDNTGQSLRLFSTNTCYLCQRELSRAYYQDNKERMRIKRREYYHRDPERWKVYKRRHFAKKINQSLRNKLENQEN
jgi:hypothetical protein